MPQLNFPANNLNFHWKWWDQIKANFLNISYFTALSFIYCSQWGQILYEITFEKRYLPHCTVSLHSALEWKIRRPNFQFLKIRLSFFVKICPNCVLFLIFFARCIIQFRWNQPTQRTETVPFFIDFFIHIFSSFYIKLDIFLLHITMIMMYLPTVLSIFWHSLNGHPLLYLFATNVFANLQARLAGYCLARQSCPIVKLFVEINVCCYIRNIFFYENCSDQL